MEIKNYVGSIRKASDYVRSRAPGTKPKIGVILGSGLSKAVPHLERVTIPYPISPAILARRWPAMREADPGERAAAESPSCRAAFTITRHSMSPRTARARARALASRPGHHRAVGSMREKIRPGDFTLISDHINLMGRNPLRAFHEEEFGEMFPDMSKAYEPALRKLALAVARKRKIPMHQGVYVAVGGPSYETPAEIRAFRSMGGEVVGMSVVPEVVVARQMDLKTLVLTWTSNMASGMKGAALSHPDVLALGDKVSHGLRAILEDLLKEL